MRRADAVTDALRDTNPSGLSECDGCADANAGCFPHRIGLSVIQSKPSPDAVTVLSSTAPRGCRQSAWTLIIPA
jgi:hypothetical protein